MTKRTLISVAALVGLLVPRLAGAQEFLRDRRYQEGVGIRSGDFEFHPGVAGEVGYDSNWFLRSDKDGPNVVNAGPAAPVKGSAVLRVTPSLTLRTLSGRRTEEGTGEVPEQPSMRFQANLSGTYEEFLNSDLSNQRNFAIASGARLDILPGHPVGAAVFGSYVRTIQPTIIGDPDLSYNRDDLGAGAEINTTPGGGTLDWHWGYQFHTTLFEDQGGQQFNNLTHELYTKGRWKFRPRTALLYDATVNFHQYTNEPAGGNGLDDGVPVRSRLGLEGLITPRFSALAMVGYGATFFNNAGSNQVQEYDSVIGQGELKFYLTANPGGGEETGKVSLALSTLSLGYQRDFQISYLANFYGIDRGYANLDMFFAGRVLMRVSGDVAALEYGDVYPPQAAAHVGGFTDTRVGGTFYGEYRFSDEFALTGTFRYTAELSNTQLPEPGPPAGQVYDMNWKRYEAYLGVRWFL
jgi:hypothetical protein